MHVMVTRQRLEDCLGCKYGNFSYKRSHSTRNEFHHETQMFDKNAHLRTISNEPNQQKYDANHGRLVSIFARAIFYSYVPIKDST